MSHTTVVLQSQRADAVKGWQGRCLASVQSWAEQRGYAYRFEGDAFLKRLPAALCERFSEQTVVLTDFARLLWLQEVLREGFQRAIWVDADLLLFRDFEPPDDGDWLGREVWVQRDGSRLRRYRKVHNAWLQFGRASAFLPFYIERATVLLERVKAPVVPQFIGPKLLTAWHNIAPFGVEERIGMGSPLVLRDLLAFARGEECGNPGFQALGLLAAGHAATLCGLNLCASYEDRVEDGVRHSARDYDDIVDALLKGCLAEALEA